jgi:acetate kinase
MNILVVNCGSSSVKLQILDTSDARATPLADASAERLGPEATLTARRADGEVVRRQEPIGDWGRAIGTLLDVLGEGSPPPVDAIGHRVVQGGEFYEPTIIDDAVIAAIDRARRLAPLHNGPALEGIRAIRQRLPDTPMAAVFDTAFHASMPAEAAHYALPEKMAIDWGVRRFGYHGIAHRSMSERFAELARTPPDDVVLVTLQLGNGCSAAAVRGRASVDTSMGFTPVEGLVMGTRPGDVDPSVVTYLQREHGVSPEDVETMLNHQSGLLGVSGTTADMAALLEQEAQGEPRALAAIEMFCYRVRKYIGAYMAVLGKTQAIVFGGGIGERSPEVRRRICEPLEALGILIDQRANLSLNGAEGRFSADASPIAAWVIPSDEERVIARDTYDTLTR